MDNLNLVFFFFWFRVILVSVGQNGNVGIAVHCCSSMRVAWLLLQLYDMQDGVTVEGLDRNEFNGKRRGWHGKTIPAVLRLILS